MDCNETQTLLHGYIDGELDVVHSMALAQHLQGCPLCTQTHATQQAMRTALRNADLYYAPPAAFQKNLRAALRRAEPRAARTSWWGQRWLQLGVAFAVGVLLVWHGGWWQQDTGEPLLQDIITGHVRSLMVQHLTDVVSSDHHTVKPWFEGLLDFSPPVPDLAAQGFSLIGGRLDYLDNRPVAALVYRRRQHVINLFVWPGVHATPWRPVTHQGYNLISWSTADLQYWAISTLNMTELQDFVEAVQAAK